MNTVQRKFWEKEMDLANRMSVVRRQKEDKASLDLIA